MDGFKTSRVLVLDDKPDQAIPVLKALGKLGIGATYRDGSSDLKPQKCAGLRLLVVDMVLSEQGADANDPKGCMSILMGALQAAMEESGEPLIIICWTGNESLTKEFETAFKQVFTKTPVHAFVLLDKTRFEQHPELLIGEIEKCLKQYDVLSVLMRWEQVVHDAATRTTARLTEIIRELANQKEGSPSECAYRVCAALAIAERGSRLDREDGGQVIRSLFDALTPLLTDALDHSNSKIPPFSEGLVRRFQEAALAALPRRNEATSKSSVTENSAAPSPKDDVSRVSASRSVISETSKSAASTEIPAAGTATATGPAPVADDPKKQASVQCSPPNQSEMPLSNKARCAINTLLLVSREAPKDMCPGTIFTASWGSSNQKILAPVFEFKDVLPDTFVTSDNKAPAGTVPILIETTPVCDFAQNHQKMVRFVPGVLCPLEHLTTLRDAFYIKKFGPVLLSSEHGGVQAGEYAIALNLHFVLSLKRDQAKRLEPGFRLKSLALADLVSSLGDHMSRPGILQVNVLEQE